MNIDGLPSILDEHFATLNRIIPNPEEHELAKRHAPLIRFDVREPFLPSVAGYSVFHDVAESLSFPREITLPEGVTTVIEYAIWWDWDIGHLYELEHVWVYLNAVEQVVRVDASWHGGWNEMIDGDGPPLQGGRAIVYSEPGKHAFAATLEPMHARKQETDASCGSHAGSGGVWVTPLFEGIITTRNRENNRLVHTYLGRRRFAPTYTFEKVFDLRNVALVPWPALHQWIPSRVAWWCHQLDAAIPYGQRRVLRIAHRGASAYAPESTPEAIKKAAELHSDMVEVDVRFTADHVPVIAHDSDLKRMFGVQGHVAEMTLDEIQAAIPTDKGALMTFEELVALCREAYMGLYLDFKALDAEGMVQIVEMLRKKHLFSHTIFSSFRPDWVAEMKAQIPDAATSVLFASTHVEPVALAKSVHANYVHPCWERFDAPQDYLTDDWLAAVRGAGLGIICWHEERPPVIAALKALGVDGICSDRPDLL